MQVSAGKGIAQLCAVGVCLEPPKRYMLKTVSRTIPDTAGPDRLKVFVVPSAPRFQSTQPRRNVGVGFSDAPKRTPKR